MYKPLVIILVFYIIGLLLGHYSPFPFWFYAIVAGISLAVEIYIETRCFKKNRIFLYVMFLILGAVITQSIYEKNTGNIAVIADKEVTIRGTVIREPEVKRDITSYVVRVEKELSGSLKEMPRGRVLVSIENGGTSFFYGDILEISGTFKRPEEPGNPGEFNYRTYLARRGIHLVLWVDNESGVRKIGSRTLNPAVAFCIKCKQRFQSIIERTLPENQAFLLEGILFGTDERIDSETLENFAQTGLSHLLSVSGYHVGLVAALCLFCSKTVGLGRKAETVLLIVSTLFYAVLTGANPPVLRSVIMIWIFILSRFFNRVYDWQSSISLAAFVILFFDPYALFEPGFQLSFAATWGILYLMPVIYKLMSGKIPWAHLVALTVAAQVSTFPLTTYYFNFFPVLFLPANLIIAPLITLVMLLGGVSVVLGFLWLPLAEVVNVSTGLILELIIKTTAVLGRLPFSSMIVGEPPLIGIILFYLGLIFVMEAIINPDVSLKLLRLWHLFRKQAVLGFLFLFCIMLWTNVLWVNKNLEVTFIDVGQGDAALIRSPAGRNILIDTGGCISFKECSYNSGERVVVPLLKRKGIKNIDLLILTHPHSDHIKGADPVLKNFRVNTLLINPQFCTVPEGKNLISRFALEGVQVKKIIGGEKLVIDESIVLEVLSPPDDTITDENNDSLVLKVSYKHLDILFTGDAENQALKTITSNYPGLKAEIVKIPHHGSEDAWYKEFYQLVDPELAIISVGTNYFGHPNPTVINGLGRLYIPVLTTFRDGAITIISDGYNYKVKKGKRMNFHEYYSIKQEFRKTGVISCLSFLREREIFNGSISR